jgi:hypothetical protein
MYQSSLVNVKTYNMMKKIIPMIVAMLFAMTTIGQTVKIDVVTDPVVPGTVDLEINFTGFPEVGAITLYLDYDADLLNYSGPGSIPFLGGTFIINDAGWDDHTMILAWSNYSGPAMIDETLALQFDYYGGFSTGIDFVGNSEITYVEGDPYTVTYINGLLTPDLSNPDGTASLGSVQGIAGTSVSVPVTITDAGGFHHVASSMSLNIAYDTDKLIFTGVTDNSIDFNVSHDGGVIELLKDAVGTFNFPLMNPVVNLTFDYLGGGTADVAWKSGSIVTDNEGNILITSFTDGEVTLDPNFTGKLTISKVASPDNPVDPVAVPIKAEGFETEEVGEISLKINFDSQKLTYAGFVPDQFTGWDVTSINQAEGILEIEKTSAIPLTVLNGDLITLNFEYSSGVAVIGFDPGTFVKDIDTDPIPTQLVDGHVAAFTNLAITVLLEGLYDGGGNMRKAQDHDGTNPFDKFAGTVADQITVRLHDKDDYNNIIWTQIEVDLNTDGTASLVVPSQYDGEYYLTILNRNHLETVSADPIDFSPSSVTYDFTDSASKAYEDNQKDLLDGKFAIFAGDVMQTGEVDVTDRAEVINNLGNQGYISPDINGTGEVDVTDRADVINALGREAKTP